MNQFSFFVFQCLFFLSLGLKAQVYHVTSFSEAFANSETVKSVNLKGKTGVIIPGNINELKVLEELNLSGLDLEKLPASLNQCESLRKIDLSYNPNLDVNQIGDVLRGLALTSLSLEGCKLSLLPFQVSEIRTLNYLDLSNNLIFELPDNFGKLQNLQSLNLALNQFDSIHTGLNALPQLKKLDLSFNPNVVIDHLINSKLDFPALEEIVLIGVKRFPSTLNQRSGRLKKLDLSFTSFKDINQATKDSFFVDHVVAKKCKKLDYDFACRSLEKSGVKKLELLDEDMSDIPRGIQKMKQLNELIIEDSKINYVPSLNNHKCLKKITIESEKLETIFSSVSRLDSLSYLNVKHTGLKHKEVEKLINHFPHAEIVYNPQKHGVKVKFPEYLKNIDFGVPFKNLRKPKEVFGFNSNEPKKIVLESGTELNLSRNSFVSSNGLQYDGDVVFEVVEYKSSMDIYFSGLPMVYDSTDLYAFQSGGMYDFVAKGDNGEELSLAKNKLVNVNTKLPDDNGGFQAYQLVDGSWVNNGRPAQPSITEFNSLELSRMQMQGSFSEKKPVFLHEGFAIEVWKTKDTKGYKLRFLREDLSMLNVKRPSSGKVSINALSAFRNENWIVIDPNNIEKLKQLRKDKSISKTLAVSPFSISTPDYKFKDIVEVTLVPQFEKDNFLLTIVTIDNAYQLEIVQDMDRLGPKSSKRRIKNQWKRYLRTTAKVDIHNKKVRLAYEDNMRTYQAAAQKHYNDSVLKADNPTAYYQMERARVNYQNMKNNIFNSVAANSSYNFDMLGVCNIDRLLAEVNKSTREVSFSSYTASGDSLELDHISILSSVLPAAVKYTGNKIYVSKSGVDMVVGQTKQGELAYISRSNLKEYLNTPSEVAKLKFEIIHPNEVNVAEFSKALAL